MVISQASVSAIEVILAVRVFALFNKSYRIAYLLAILLTAEKLTVAVNAFYAIPEVQPSDSCILADLPEQILNYSAVLLVTQSVLIGLMIFKYTTVLRSGWGRTPLVSVLVRDGSIVYIIVLVFAVVLTAGCKVQDKRTVAMFFWLISISSVASSLHHQVPPADDGSPLILLSGSLSGSEDPDKATFAAAAAAIASPLSTTNVTLTESPTTPAGGGNNSASLPLQLAILCSVITVVILLGCYPLYKKHLPDYSSFVLRTCAWLCPPRRGLFSQDHQQEPESQAVFPQSRRCFLSHHENGTRSSVSTRSAIELQSVIGADSSVTAQVVEQMSTEFQTASSSLSTSMSHASAGDSALGQVEASRDRGFSLPSTQEGALPFPMRFDCGGEPKVDFVSM
ncbi:hypothetical protein BU15DRAFT_78881 [Melanogaster broomeanus]|nr:hypothetical protein BU15DRAFT_78881 [Melanogaster broomeanus]